MLSTISQGSENSLFDMLRSIQKEQEEMLKGVAPDDLAVQPINEVNRSFSAHASPSNLMSQNFAPAERKESKYINAALVSFQVSKQVDTQQTSRVNALLGTLGGIQGPRLYKDGESKGGVPEATIQLAMKRIKDAEEHEASERNLDEIKKKIEEKTAEATAPTDANGNPVEVLPPESAGEAAPMPEISGSNPAQAPAPDISAAPASEVAASTPAPATPSINITV